jgi:nucleoside 2-deoxyribosyltransferase
MSYLSQINTDSSSRSCFVAMSFDPKLRQAYEDGILPAIKETGFIPVIVSNVHVDSDKTINDAIIAGIKEAKFVIADFTMHKAGVYFEAGYALGRGLKVIYTCSKKDLRKAHFDTRNFQHIVWETPEELKQKLVEKIKAFILD